MAKSQTKPPERKALPIYVVNVDTAEGIVEAVVNVFGIIDLGADIIHNGAYTKTLNERGNQVRVKVLDSHNTDSVLRVIGKPLEIREIGRDELARMAPQVIQQHPEATGGLFTRTQYLLDTHEGDGAFKRIASGAVSEYSIALDVLDADYSKVKSADGKEVTVRNIRSLRMWEYSPVVFGMNQATVTTDVKASDAPTVAESAPMPEQKQATILTRLEARMRISAAYCITDWLDYGTIDGETVAMLNGAVDTAMTTLRGAIPAAVADMPLVGMYDSMWAADGATDAKAGRMISGANRAKLQAAVDALQALLDASAPADAPTDATPTEEAKGASIAPVTGSRPDAASIIETADIDKELFDLTLMMEMTA